MEVLGQRGDRDSITKVVTQVGDDGVETYSTLTFSIAPTCIGTLADVKQSKELSYS